MTPTAIFTNPISDTPDFRNIASLADSKGVRLISSITAILVLLLAIAAFVMSYDALHALAAESGAIAPRFAYVFPLVVDGAIIVFSIGALRASLCAESTRVPMIMVVAVTSLSVTFNIAHAPFGLLSCVMAATPPFLLFLAFESLMRQLRSEIGRRGAIASMEIIAREHSEALGRLDALHSKEQRLATQIATLGEEKRQKRSTRRNGAAGSATTEAERGARVARVSELKGGGANNAAIARKLGISTATVRRDLAELRNLRVA